MERRKTRRDLLKTYYQEEEVREVVKEVKEVKRIDPIDIDSPGFHAELAHNMMLKEQGLTEIIQRDNQLVMEIKELDGNIKTLVYKNYSKFLGASGAIVKVKNAAESIEQRVFDLQQKLNSVTQSLSELSKTMEPKAQKIQELGKIHSLVTKLSGVIEIPSKLSELLEQKQYADTVAYYSRASILLNKFSHITMFKQIQEESQHIMSQIGMRIQKKVFSGQGTLVQLCEGFGLLVGLKAMPASDLGKQFLYRSTVFLDTLLKPKENIVLLQNSQEDETYPHFQSFFKFHKDYLDQISLFVDCYDCFFLEQRNGQGNSTGLNALKESCFAHEMTDQERLVAKDDLKRMLSEKQDTYFTFLDKQLQTTKHSTVSPKQYVAALTNLRKDVATALPLRKYTDLDQRLAKLTMVVLDRIIHGIFGKVNEDFIVKIDEFSGDSMFNITRLMSNWIKEALIAKALPALEDFMSSESMHSFGSTELLIRVKDALVQFWNDLADQMMKRQSNQPFLVFSRLSMEWSKGVIEAVFSMYQQRLFIPKNGIFIPELSDSHVSKIITDTCSFFAKLSKKLASRFVQDKLLVYTYKLKDYTNNPLLVDQVTMVHSLWRQIHQDLEGIQTQVKNTFKSDEPKKSLAGKQTLGYQKRPSMTPDLSRSKTSSHKVSQTLFDTKFDPLMSTLDKLFDERLTYLPQQLELKPIPIVSSLVKSILKCLVEFARLKSFTCKQYQQIQVDVAYIKLHFWEYADEKVVSTLCDDILSSAELHGIDIQPLDSMVSTIYLDN